MKKKDIISSGDSYKKWKKKRDITSSGIKKKIRYITSSGDSGSPGFLPGLSPNHLGSLAEIKIKIRHRDKDRK